MTPTQLKRIKNRRRYESKQKKYGTFLAWLCNVIHKVAGRFK
jgi:hypothetical protein